MICMKGCLFMDTRYISNRVDHNIMADLVSLFVDASSSTKFDRVLLTGCLWGELTWGFLNVTCEASCFIKCFANRLSLTIAHFFYRCVAFVDSFIYNFLCKGNLTFFVKYVIADLLHGGFVLSSVTEYKILNKSYFYLLSNLYCIVVCQFCTSLFK